MTTPRPIAAVVFDMDGTLIDSESVYRAALVQALGDVGLAADAAFLHGLNGLAGPAVTARIQARFGADLPSRHSAATTSPIATRWRRTAFRSSRGRRKPCTSSPGAG